MNTSRKLSPYEMNQLLKAKIDPKTIDWEQNSETPLEYLTGKAEFYGRMFKVNKNVLIPRVETEEIIDLSIRAIETSDKSPVTIADVGTGSGCIGITLFLELQKKGINSEIILSDISEPALTIARANVKLFRIPSKNVLINKVNLLTLKPYTLIPDLIVANLPYIPSSRIPKLDESVKDHEPRVALDGGIDGLKYIKKLISQARKLISLNGVMILEIDSDNKLKDFAEFKKSWNLKIKKDRFKRNRFLTLSLVRAI